MKDRSLRDNHVTSLYIDKSVQIWIGTKGGYLHRFKPESQDFEIYYPDPLHKNSLDGYDIFAMLEDCYGNFWVGTFGGGLSKFDRKTKTFCNYLYDPYNPASLSGNDVLSIYEDRAGIIWIGTHLGKGLSKFDPKRKKFIHITKEPNNPNSLSDNIIYAIHEDTNGALWIGTQRGGLNKFEKGKYSSFTYDPEDPTSLSQNHVRAIHEDRDGDLWIGTFSNGLDKLDRTQNRFLHFKHESNNPNSLSDNGIRDIFETEDGVLWIATLRGGLNRFDKKTGVFTHYKHDADDQASISGNSVRVILPGIENTLWIGTWANGFNKLDLKTGRFTRFLNDPLNDNSLSDNSVLCFHHNAKDNVLWIGTYGGGLNKLNLTTMDFRHYTEKTGLPDDVIYGILEDGNGNLWISTDNGIMMFNPKTEKATVYDERDGLQSMEYSGGAYWQSRSGEMFFGGINGFNRFYPLRIQNNLHVPAIAITDFKVFNETVSLEDDKVELAYYRNFISFAFSALDYTDPPKNQYAYILEEIDKEWQYVDANKRFANYTNLSPGTYTFRVKGSNNNGLWNEKGTAIRIHIHPPFWQTWWFYLFTTIGLLGAVLFVLNYRVRQKVKRLLELEKIRMRESERILKKAAVDFHDEIGHKSTKIALFGELLKTRCAGLSPDAVQLVGKMTETSKSLSLGMRDFIWMLDPEKASFYDLAERLRDFGNEFFDEVNMQFHTYGLTEHMQKIALSIEQRKEINLLFKEAMHNTIKHSACKNIELRFEIANNHIRISLHDDGKGFDAASCTRGTGLKSMQQRA
ncbi:MAG: two-component regulator propeller domain-containing protein, partial [bacterium]